MIHTLRHIDPVCAHPLDDCLHHPSIASHLQPHIMSGYPCSYSSLQITTQGYHAIEVVSSLVLHALSTANLVHTPDQ